MFIENLFGSIAFVTSIIGLFPQVYKAIKTKSTEDISLLMLINFLVCSIAWIVYGFYSQSLYVQLSNVLGLVSCLILIALKKYYDHKALSNRA